MGSYNSSNGNGNRFSWATAVKALLIAILLRILLDTAPGSQPNWDYNHDEWAFKLKQSSNAENVEVVRFLGGDGSTELVGHLYLPQGDNSESSLSSSSLTPVIVLGHGLGLCQDCGLSPFVEAFTEAGFAAFTFDYATFGASAGLPRHVVHPKNHILDIEAAIQMIRHSGVSKGLDVNRIGLWGTSLGGGHSLVVAANHANSNINNTNDIDQHYLKAVVALVPHIASGAEALAHNFDSNSAVALLKVTHAMIKWAYVSIWSTILSLKDSNTSSWYVPLHGMPGSEAFMQNPGDDEGYSALIPTGDSNLYGWNNAATVISALRILLYRPLNTSHSLAQQSDEATITPILMIAAEKDTLCPLEFIQRAFAMMTETSKSVDKRKLVVLKDVGHFDVYKDNDERKLLQQVLRTTVDFFAEHL